LLSLALSPPPLFRSFLLFSFVFFSSYLASVLLGGCRRERGADHLQHFDRKWRKKEGEKVVRLRKKGEKGKNLGSQKKSRGKKRLPPKVSTKQEKLYSRSSR